MDAVVAFIGMACLILIGIVCILGLGIVIAYEVRTINRLRAKPPFPPVGPFHAVDDRHPAREWN